MMLIGSQKRSKTEEILTQAGHFGDHDHTSVASLRRCPTSNGIGAPLHRNTHQALVILESTAAAVSRAVRRPRARPVRDMEAYLLWSCVRRITRIAARESREQPNHALLNSAAASDRGACQSELEQKLSLRDALCFMDDRTRELFAMRCERYSWKEIADGLGYSNAHSAEVQYFKGLRAARQRLNRRLRRRRQA